MSLSYLAGPSIPLLDTTIGQQLEVTANLFPDRLALVSRHQAVRFTWAELLAATGRLAHGLLRLGLQPEDRVGVWATSCAEWMLLHLATARAGIVLVNINPANRAHELAFVLRKSGMKAIFLRERDARVDYSAVLSEAVEHGARNGETAALKHTVLFGTTAWDSLCTCTDTVPLPKLSPWDVTNIQYTSGTTGLPKGVLLTHHNILNNGYLISLQMGYTERDVICLPVPLSHCFGCVMGTMCAVTSGAAIVLPNWTFNPLLTLEAIAEERATSIYGVPTMFIAELRHPAFSQFDLSSLRTGIMAGAPCPIEIMKQVQTDMHCRQMSIAYGLTETSPVLTMPHLDDDLEPRVSTVGTALPCTELAIASLETGELLPRGIQGEVRARGYAVMKGYDREPEATAAVIDADGWLHTGDLGVMREDGYIKITGRAKDMIIRGGENIYPREIEEFLYTHPHVAEVHVTGLPDDRLGEIVLAWIRLKSAHECTQEEIRVYCRGEIAHFKIPEVIRFVESYPTTVSGKIQKFRIREIEMEERGLETVATAKMA